MPAKERLITRQDYKFKLGKILQSMTVSFRAYVDRGFKL